MICTENIHRITKYFLFSILILFHLCFAQDEIVQRLGEEDGFLQLSASRRPYNLERTSADYQQKSISTAANQKKLTDSQHYKTVFFIVLGLGLAIIVSLLYVCFKVARVFEEINTSSIAGATVHPPNTQATYSSRAGIAVSYVNTAYTSGPHGSDRPPDYATVTTTDAINRNAAFPQVVITHIETPPPMYEDRPVFK